MRPLNCPATRRRLNAFHDGELEVGDQIAVASHLAWCDSCAKAADDLHLIGDRLRAATPALPLLSKEEAAAFATAVVSRSKAERDSSLLASLADMFADMRLVYAATGAGVAVLVCAIAMLTMLHFANDERPDALAVMPTFSAAPGMSPIVIDDGEVRTRWTARVRQANELAEQDAVFALSAVLTKEGRVPTLQHLRRGRSASVAHAKEIEGLLDSLSRARFEPVSEGPLASSMVWLITSTTVRATKTQPDDLPLPAPKKHAERSRPAGSIA